MKKVVKSIKERALEPADVTERQRGEKKVASRRAVGRASE